jgi:hypothetical protein
MPRLSVLRVAVVLAIALFAARSSAQPALDPIKLFLDAKPSATGNDEKALKEQKNTTDSTTDILSALQMMDAAGQFLLVDSADQADVAIAVRSRRQAAIGPKIIVYGFTIGRGTMELEAKAVGGVWNQAALEFKDSLVGWARDYKGTIKKVAARRTGEPVAGMAGYPDLIESGWAPAVVVAVKELKGMGANGLSTGVPPLLAMLASDKEDYRKFAAAELKELTGQKFGTDRARWDQWWAAHPASAAKRQY